jgi:hypothetical protein
VAVIRTWQALALGALAGMAALLSLEFVFRLMDRPANVPLYTSQSMQECQAEKIKRLQNMGVTLDLLTGIAGACYSEIHSQGLLNDFHLRRLKAIQQHYADNVTLWMVVSITISGVVLAGLQLLASYKLAILSGTALAESNDLSVEKGKLVVRSSVTGLMILIISFAFFLVFVKFIYTIDTQNLDRTIEPKSGKPQAELPLGSLSPIPTN